MKYESEKKDEVIKHYKAKRDKRQKEKRDNSIKEQRESSTSSDGIRTNSRSGNSDKRGNQQNVHKFALSRTSETPSVANPPTESPSLSTRRGVAIRTVSTSAATATATATATASGGMNVQESGYSQATGFGRSNGQSRNRISLTSASPSTATATLKTSLKREISGEEYSVSFIMEIVCLP